MRPPPRRAPGPSDAEGAAPGPPLALPEWREPPAADERVAHLPADLEGSPLFAGLGPDQRDQLARHARLRTYADGQVIRREGERFDSLVILRSGSARVEKVDRESGDAFALAAVQAGGAIGELGLVDDASASATVVADGPVQALSLDLAAVLQDPQAASLRAALFANLAPVLSARLRRSSETAVAGMRAELELSRQREDAGRFVIALVVVACACMLGMAALHEVPAAYVPSQTWVSAGSIVLTAAVMIGLLRGSPGALERRGVSLRGFWRHAGEATLVTLPALAALVALKWAFLRAVPALQGLPLFAPGAIFGEEPFRAGFWAMAVALYAALVPLQELYYRAGLQGSLQQMMPTPGRTNWKAILIANLVFASVHSWIGVRFAAAALLPGLLWGWLYDRQRSLVGASVSHALFGAFALFVLGMQTIVGGR